MPQELKRSLVREQGPMTPKYKEFTNGPHNINWRIVSVSSCHKADDGTYIVSGKSRLFWSVWYFKIKVDNIFWTSKCTRHEWWQWRFYGVCMQMNFLISFFIIILIYGFIVWLLWLWNKETPWFSPQTCYMRFIGAFTGLFY